jgi:hypothetical protein
MKNTVYLCIILLSSIGFSQINPININKQKNLNLSTNQQKQLKKYFIHKSSKTLVANTTSSASVSALPDFGNYVKLDPTKLYHPAAWLILNDVDLNIKRNELRIIGKRTHRVKLKFLAKANTKYLLKFNISSYGRWDKTHRPIFFDVDLIHGSQRHSNSFELPCKPIFEGRNTTFLHNYNTLETIIQSNTSEFIKINTKCYTKTTDGRYTIFIPYLLDSVEIIKL